MCKEVFSFIIILWSYVYYINKWQTIVAVQIVSLSVRFSNFSNIVLIRGCSFEKLFFSFFSFLVGWEDSWNQELLVSVLRSVNSGTVARIIPSCTLLNTVEPVAWRDIYLYLRLAVDRFGWVRCQVGQMVFPSIVVTPSTSVSFRPRVSNAFVFRRPLKTARDRQLTFNWMVVCFHAASTRI